MIRAILEVKVTKEEDGTHNYLVFQPMYRYFKVIANTKYISEWKSKGLSDESIKPPSTFDNSLSQLIHYICNKIRLKFDRNCLKQPNKPAYNHRTIVNIYIVYELGASSSFNDDPTLKYSLFGADMSSSVHVDNKVKVILILDFDAMQG